MKIQHPHPWNLRPAEAIALQQELRGRVILEDQLRSVQRVAGVDVGFEAAGTVTRAAVAVLRYPELEVLETAIARRPTTFPYLPGLLSFRELPAVLEALEQLREPPDVLLCDGQGIAHPRRLGIASHLGLLVDTPSIGVAKTRLCGTHEEPPNQRGAWTPLWMDGDVIGAVLRTRPGVRPLYISSGHRVSLETAIQFVMACCTRYPLPAAGNHSSRASAGVRLNSRSRHQARRQQFLRFLEKVWLRQ